MNKVIELLKKLYKVYVIIGIVAVATMTILVVGAVLLRYIFGFSSPEVEELITVVFVFTTFWGVGIGIIEDEHIGVNALVEKFPKKVQVMVTVFTQLLTVFTLVIIFYFSIIWVQKVSGQLSYGMAVPMTWLYSIVPVSLFIAILCSICKFISCFYKPIQMQSKEVK